MTPVSAESLISKTGNTTKGKTSDMTENLLGKLLRLNEIPLKKRFKIKH